MSAGGGSMIFPCDAITKSIHSCPSETCPFPPPSYIRHYICVRDNIRKPLCQRYVGGCCLNKDCKEVHCAASALYFAEQVGLQVHVSIKELIWKKILVSCNSNPKYYWSVVNLMNEIFNEMALVNSSFMFGILISKNIRDIITSYIGSSWYIGDDESDSWNPFSLLMTKNKRFENLRSHTCNSLITMLCRCCEEYPRIHTKFVIIKKLSDGRKLSKFSGVKHSEYLIKFACENCYDAKSPDPLYDLGLSGFSVFLIDKHGMINEDKCIIKIEHGNLEVIKFDG